VGEAIVSLVMCVSAETWGHTRWTDEVGRSVLSVHCVLSSWPQRSSPGSTALSDVVWVKIVEDLRVDDALLMKLHAVAPCTMKEYRRSVVECLVYTSRKWVYAHHIVIRFCSKSANKVRVVR
jgi:hypothetical protein